MKKIAFEDSIPADRIAGPFCSRLKVRDNGCSDPHADFLSSLLRGNA
jgi:hypothetical protein